MGFWRKWRRESDENWIKHLNGSLSPPTLGAQARQLTLVLAPPVAFSLVGPLYFGFAHDPYRLVITWASTCVVIFCWQATPSIKYGLGTAPPSIIGRFLLVVAVVMPAAIGFFGAGTLAFVLARALH
jgi:hypothetical protein